MGSNQEISLFLDGKNAYNFTLISLTNNNYDIQVS